MELSPYLNFDGQCAAAFRFYAEALGGKVTSMTFSESPMATHVPADWQDKIINAELRAGALTLRGCDAPPPHYQPMQGFGVTLIVETPEEADRVFAALSPGGAVTMAMQETFWSARFGMVTDRFGTPWMVGCGQAA